MVAILFDNYGPYLIARARAAGNLMPVLAVELYGRSAEYAWRRENAEDGLEFVTLLPDVDSTRASAAMIHQRMDEVFARHRPTAVAIPGWGYKGALVALQWCLANRIPPIMMSESTAWDADRNGWKEWIKSQIVQLASSSLVGGSPHAEYIAHLGMPADRVFTGYDAVDNEYFATESRKHRNAATQCIRPCFLSSNRFILKKNLFRLVEAYAAYARRGQGAGARDQKTGVSDGHRPPLQCWPLVLLGDGEQKPALIAKCHELGLQVIEEAPWESDPSSDLRPPTSVSSAPTPDSCLLTSGLVFFPGFRQIDELPRFYAHAGAFVHASTTEQWGLVVNEAMACGLPVIVSKRVGCSRDLVVDGVNGFTFDPYDVDQLAALLARVSSPDFPLQEYGEAASRHIAGWGLDRFAEGMKTAAAKAIEVGPKRATLIQKAILKLLTFR